MTQTTTYPLAVPFTVNLSNVAMFDKYVNEAESVNKQHDQMRARVDYLMHLMISTECQDLGAEIKKLRLLIRQSSFGGAKVEHAGDIDDDSLGEQTLTEAELQLLNKIWRKLAARLHPDRGGRRGEFEKLERAYRRRDLRTLRYMHHVVFDHHRIGWRSSNVEYAQELLRIANMRMFEFKGSLEFQLLVADMRKNSSDVAAYARAILVKKRNKLHAEYVTIVANFKKVVNTG